MAHSDFEAMLGHAKELVTKFLRAHGEFIPFGISVAGDGSIESVAGDIGSEHPSGAEVVRFLREHFREEAKGGRVLASAVCYMGTASHPSFSEPQEALVIDMDRIGSEALRLAIPYEVQASGVSYGSILASRLKGYLSEAG